MDDPAFAIDTTVDINTQTILLLASQHDVAALKPLLRIPGNASVQDPETGFTPLHAAIAACGPVRSELNGENGIKVAEAEGEEEVDIGKAKETVRELFLGGAIWNDLDVNDETPGCLAWRLGRKELYELCVDAGVRAELLLGMMGGYEELDGEDSEEEYGEEAERMDEDAHVEEQTPNGEETTNDPTENDSPNIDVNSAVYLSSTLTLTPKALLDSTSNGVMMTWEEPLMRLSAESLLPSDTPHFLAPGKRILNIGYGLGLIDSIFASSTPSIHHIIEAHPIIISLLSSPESPLGPNYIVSPPPPPSSENGPETLTIPTHNVFPGKWQDVLPALLESDENGIQYDAIYFDTFAESYTDLKQFFTRYVPLMLSEDGGKFGFFNGLGADRKVCYDVYHKVLDFDLGNEGFDIEWTDVDVKALEGQGKDGQEIRDMGKEGEGEWEGVRRRYWTLNTYRLPTCTLQSDQMTDG